MREDVWAFWVTSPGHGELRRELLDNPGPGEVAVRTVYTGISRGTESLVFRGKVPPSEWQRMRAPFQSGEFPAPVKYGYANVGIVEAGPAHLLGRYVFTLFPHQTFFVVPVTAVHVLPDEVPPGRAVLAANLETAINGLWDARPHIGDRISVIGAGTVGCLAAWLAARIVGCQVQLVDRNPERDRIATALGLPFSTPESAASEADVVIHASGSPAGLVRSLDLAAFEAGITELSWFGEDAVALPLGGAFHAKRLTIASSQVGTIPAAQRGRWSHSRRLQLALHLLTDSTLDHLITGESEFAALPEVMAAVTADGSTTLCHRIRYV